MQWARVFFTAFLGLALGLASAASVRADSTAPAGQVTKVLPLYLDQKGHVAPSPSLFDRDAYQVYLTRHTNEITGLRFDVSWKWQHANGVPMTLKLELQGIGANSLPRQTVLEQTVTPKLFHHWATLTLTGTNYNNFGVLAGWRATLWNGNQLLSEQKSFLWSAP